MLGFLGRGTLQKTKELYAARVDKDLVRLGRPMGILGRFYSYGARKFHRARTKRARNASRGILGRPRPYGLLTCDTYGNPGQLCRVDCELLSVYVGRNSFYRKIRSVPDALTIENESRPQLGRSIRGDRSLHRAATTRRPPFDFNSRGRGQNGLLEILNRDDRRRRHLVHNSRLVRP